MSIIPDDAWDHPLVASHEGRVLIRRTAEMLAYLALQDPSVMKDSTFDTPEGRILVRRLATALVVQALAHLRRGTPTETPPLAEYDPCPV